jgi:dienelactone hydrolase
MKKILSILLIAIPTLCYSQHFVQGKETYDMSPEVIDTAPLRSTFFTYGKFFPSKAESFAEKADKSLPVVIHLHGCGGVYSADQTVRQFYSSLGMHFIMTDFHRRKDASPGCVLSGGSVVFTGNPDTRWPARRRELESHIFWLQSNGFNKIVVTGHSEGGIIAQLLNVKVDAVISHSVHCVYPNRNRYFSPENKVLQLISKNDPYGRRFTLCAGDPDHSNYTSITSEVPSHDPFADHAWKDEIKKFLGK